MSNSGFFSIGKTLNLGYPGTVSRLADAIIENRPVESTDTNNINFGGVAVLNSDNTYSAYAATSATLGAALTASTQYTSLTVSALPAAMKKGATVQLVSGANNQTTILSADAAAGATSISVNSFTANYAYPTTTSVNIYNGASQVAGIAVREVKQGTDYLNSYENGSYSAGQPCDVLQRGSVTVTCTEGTPTAGGPVYVVTVAGAGAVSAVGNLVATSTPAGTGSEAVQLPNMQWKTGNKDSNNTTELTILSRNLA